MAVPIVYQNFVPPAIDAGNLNTLNQVIYQILGDGTNAPPTTAAARTNLGLGTIATQNANGANLINATISNPTISFATITNPGISNPAITGGTITGLSTPLPVASGGTGDAGTAWTSVSTGAITSGSGTITSANGTLRYKIIGKTVFFNLLVNITNNGTGGVSLIVANAIPITPQGVAIFAGRDGNGSGTVVSGTCGGGNTNMTIQKYDNTYPGISGSGITITGVYESV